MLLFLQQLLLQASVFINAPCMLEGLLGLWDLWFIPDMGCVLVAFQVPMAHVLAYALAVILAPAVVSHGELDLVACIVVFIRGHGVRPPA